jgi:DNA sulfur modification protein DndE
MKFMKSYGAGMMALSIALGLAPLAGPVRAEQPALQASHEQTKAIEEWTRTLAVQAATYAAPLVAMYNLRDTVAVGPHPKAKPGTLWRLEDITTPKLAAESGYVSPNVDVVYGFGFADLGVEPVILTAPDSGDRYYMIEVVDMYTNAFAYPAGGASGYKGGKFAFVAPGWKGTLPEGVTRIDAPTRWIEFQPRVNVKSEADLPAARKVLAAINLQGLSEYTGSAAPAQPAYHYESPKLTPGVATSHMQFDDPLQFWSIFSAALNENPPPADEIATVLPSFKYLGIELGKQWKPEDVPPHILAQMKVAAADIGKLALGAMPLAGTLKEGWVIPPYNTGSAGTDYLSRLAVAVFGLTANSTSQAIYYSGVLDGDNKPLTGEKKYTLTLKPPMDYAKPVAPGFWSVTMYDKRTNYTAPNPINRYHLADYDDLKKNADGSITLYVQAESPGKAKESNWLPSPKGPFYLIFRNYAPSPAVTEALKDRATFQGPPGVFPVDGE